MRYRCSSAAAAASSNSVTPSTPADTARGLRPSESFQTLHQQATEGNEYAEAVLDLLGDDPWWSENPEGVG